MITLTNTCSLKIDESITKVLKNFVTNYNRENRTQYCLNDIKCVTIRKSGLSFGFSQNFWITIPFDELEIYLD